MSGNCNHKITFDNHLKTAMNSNDNLLSTKVKSGWIVFGIAETKKKKKIDDNCQSPLSCLDLSKLVVKNFKFLCHCIQFRK